MKIAIIAHNLYPIAEPFEGGLEMITYLLCDSLLKRGHQVDLYAHPDSDIRFNVHPITAKNRIPNSLQQQMADFGHTEQSLHDFMAYTQIMDNIAAIGYDIVHNHSLHYVPMLMGNLISTNFITTLHTPMFPFLQLGALAVLDDPHQTFTMVSKSLQKIWSDAIPCSRVVYNGIDIDQWRFESHPNGDYLFWYGRICPEKGTDMAIKAAVQAGYRMVLAGPISNQSYYDDKVAPLLSHPKVNFLGHRNQKDLAPLLSNAKCLLFTSTWEEPFGLTLVESMACGTPVVAFQSGAAQEILTESTGRIVPKFDMEAFVEGIHSAIGLSRKACRQRANLFSHKAMVDAYLELYHELCDRNTAKIMHAI